jgi:tetratricopeptide (TPR) repeat protein
MGLAGCATVDRNWYSPAPPAQAAAESLELARAKKSADKKPSVEALYQLGVAYLKEERYREAAQTFGEVLERDPRHADTLLQLAGIAAKTQDRQQVIDLCSQAVQSAPDSGTARNAYGLVLLACGRSKEAAVEFQAAIARDPDAVPFYVNLIRCYAQQGKLDLALQSCRQALRRHPRSADLHIALGHVHTDRNEFPQAIAAYQKAVEFAPSKALYHHALGLAYFRSGQDEKALPCFLRAAQLAPQFTDPAARAGDVYLRRRQYEAARQHFQAIRGRVAEPARAECGLGIAYQYLGQTDLAIQSYRQAVNLDPLYAEAANNLAFLYAERRENLEEARSLAWRAARLRPRDGTMRDTLGWVYYQRKEYAQALSHLRAAQSMQPDNPEIAYHLAMVYEQQGQRDQARQELKRALRPPANFAAAPAARQALARLGRAGKG